MDKVKSALSDFTHKAGHHDTTVHETVSPAVTHETVKPHQHEEINTAVDKEVHQDHYHRTVQPVQHREMLPETHTAKLGAVQHREFDHRDHDHTKRNLAEAQAHFKDERRVEGTTSSQSVAPTIGGEHVHHHIHETIQPVIHKETIQPNVVHTTVPIHEVHHNKATHHETTALPTMTMDEFKHKGGVLSGREERYDEFKGVPKNIGAGTVGGFGHHREPHSGSTVGSEHHKHGDYNNVPNHQSSGLAGTGSGLTGTRGNDPTGPHDSRLANKADPRVDSDRVGTAGNTAGAGGHGAGQYGSQGTHGTHGTHGSGLTGAGTTGSGLTGTRGNDPTGPHDSRLGNKADPRVDSDRVGTAGNTVGAGGHGTGQYGSDHHHASTTGTGAGLTGSHNTTGTGHHTGTDGPIGSSGHRDGHHDATNTTGTKPSLVDRLNPFKDSDHDGKKGFND